MGKLTFMKKEGGIQFMPKVTHSGFGFTTKTGKNYFPNKESKIMEAGIFHDYRINISIYLSIYIF